MICQSAGDVEGGSHRLLLLYFVIPTVPCSSAPWATVGWCLIHYHSRLSSELTWSRACRLIITVSVQRVPHSWSIAISPPLFGSASAVQIGVLFTAEMMINKSYYHAPRSKRHGSHQSCHGACADTEIQRQRDGDVLSFAESHKCDPHTAQNNLPMLQWIAPLLSCSSVLETL